MMSLLTSYDPSGRLPKINRARRHRRLAARLQSPQTEPKV